MKILVTGSAGFIGGKLVEHLQCLGHEVIGFDKTEGKDLLDKFDVYRSVHGRDAVFHLAAVADLNWMRENYERALDINIRGTVNMAVACRDEGAKLYFATTCCVYGHQHVHPTTEESMPCPSELYAESKFAGERIIRGLSLTHGLQYNLMRFATVYGPGTRPALATHIFMGQALRNEPITVHGNGEQTRTLTYVDDLVDGIVAIFQSGKLNDVWNISAEREISANEMAESIKWLTESKSPIIHIPQRPGQTFKEQISAAKMRRECGWTAKTGWEEGISRMLDWFVATRQAEKKYELVRD